MQNTITTTPFPNSKKIYVKGQLHNIQVAMREISLSPTKINGKSIENKSVTVYDASGTIHRRKSYY
jgi:phosphomethylpyrimidine synthase